MSFAKPIAPGNFPAQENSLGGAVSYGQHSNVGLLWTRYQLAHQALDPDRSKWSALELSGDTKAALDSWNGYGALKCFAETARQAANGTLLKELNRRRAGSLLGVRFLESTTTWRSAIGLGNESTFENSGITLHSTYGFPIVPAASLKGIARHLLWEDPELLSIDPTLRKDMATVGLPTGQTLGDLLFGKRGPDETHEQSESDHLATVAVFDAWPTSYHPSGWFDVDVLTVHHQGYYGDSSGSAAATDNEPPVPVHFLTLRPDLTFAVPVGLTGYGKRGSKERQELCVDAAISILKSALQLCGVGAKTGSGYGRMSST